MSEKIDRRRSTLSPEERARRKAIYEERRGAKLMLVSARGRYAFAVKRAERAGLGDVLTEEERGML